MGSDESSNTKFLNKQKNQKTKPQKKTYTKLYHLLKPLRKTSHLFFKQNKTHLLITATATAPIFDSLQVFQVSPPFRDQRITPRRDSLSLRWQLPSTATWVELQHDSGFGGNWTHTLAIRWGETVGVGVGATYQKDPYVKPWLVGLNKG